MKIGPSESGSIRVDGVSVGPAAAPSIRAGSEPVVPAVATDKVSLSGSGASLARSAGAMTFDERKVEEVRRAIAEGRFPVDAKRVAETLLSDARDLIGLPPVNGRR